MKDDRHWEISYLRNEAVSLSLSWRIGGCQVENAEAYCGKKAIKHQLEMAMVTSSPPHRFCFNTIRRQPRRIATCNVVIQAKPTVLVAERLEDPGLTLLNTCALAVCSYDMTHDELCAKIPLCDALIVRTQTKVNRHVFERSKGRLKVVGTIGPYLDNIDLSAATEHGCLVVTAPSASTTAAAEHAIALLTSMARRIPQAHASLKSGNWERTKLVGVALTGKTIAIMGLGKVGCEVAERAKALGMVVVANDPYTPTERARAIGVNLVTFQEALSSADFISLHMPLTHSTINLLNRQAFSLMKRGVRIINVARSAIIEEDALVQALDSGLVAQAALDVLEPSSSNRLVDNENVIVTPHLGSVGGTPEDISTKLAEAVIGALRGEFASTAINAPFLPPKVVSELAPYTHLAEKLAVFASQLVKSLKSVRVTYGSARERSDLDTLLLKVMVLKGVIETISGVRVNIINAEEFARRMGIEVSEVRIGVMGSPEKAIEYIQIKVEGEATVFGSAASETGEAVVVGAVKEGKARVTRVGRWECDVSMEGSVIMASQDDRPGIIGSVGSILGDDNVNVNFMTLRRVDADSSAFMVIGVDESPGPDALNRLRHVSDIRELVFIKL